MSSHYTAGGMPLAFTQEDFLVQYAFIHLALWENLSKMYILIEGAEKSELRKGCIKGDINVRCLDNVHHERMHYNI